MQNSQQIHGINLWPCNAFIKHLPRITFLCDATHIDKTSLSENLILKIYFMKYSCVT